MSTDEQRGDLAARMLEFVTTPIRQRIEELEEEHGPLVELALDGDGSFAFSPIATASW